MKRARDDSLPTNTKAVVSIGLGSLIILASLVLVLLTGNFYLLIFLMPALVLVAYGRGSIGNHYNENGLGFSKQTRNPRSNILSFAHDNKASSNANRFQQKFRNKFTYWENIDNWEKKQKAILGKPQKRNKECSEKIRMWKLPLKKIP